MGTIHHAQLHTTHHYQLYTTHHYQLYTTHHYQLYATHHYQLYVHHTQLRISCTPHTNTSCTVHHTPLPAVHHTLLPAVHHTLMGAHQQCGWRFVSPHPPGASSPMMWRAARCSTKRRSCSSWGTLEWWRPSGFVRRWEHTLHITLTLIHVLSYNIVIMCIML